MVTLLSFFILAITAIVNSTPVTDSPSGDVHKTERDLKRDIFQDYDRYVRPVKNPSSTITVKLGMSPLRLRYMSEKEQTINLDTWLLMTWQDDYLQWDPNDYSNITQLRVSPSLLWKPDVTLYTGSPDTALMPKVQTNALISNTGLVMWVPPFTVNSMCPKPFRHYVTSPRSFVECNMRMGSWTYSGNEMDLQLYKDEIDLSDFQDTNPEWKLVKFVTSRESKHYACCTEPYPLVHFNVTLKRRDYYMSSENSDKVNSHILS